MGKRSDFERKPRDFYATIDPRAVAALAPLLAADTQFVEPCAGAFDMAAQLIALGHICMDAFDVEPMAPGVRRFDAMRLQAQPFEIITNPPWQRDILHPMLMHFMHSAPAVSVLLDADWFHTQQARPCLAHCTDYIAVGRLRWIRDKPVAGKENAAWYRFQLGGNGKGIRAWPQR